MHFKKMSVICRKCSCLLINCAKKLSKKVSVTQLSRSFATVPNSCSVFPNKTWIIKQNRIGFTKYSTSNFNEESEIFSKMAKDWWDESGEMKALHSMNELRVPFIRDCLLYQGYGERKTAKPLNGVDILEVGCGAGVLCEPLARLGASVVGIDTCDEALEAAKIHRESQDSDMDLQYIDSYLEDIVQVGSLKFDCVVASEVLEHVENQKDFIRMCCTILKPGGSLFVSTINKTPLSYTLAIVMAEKVLGVVPNGTHNHNNFISPDQVEEYALEGGCVVRKLHGMNYNPFQDTWSWADHNEINYILHATKENLTNDTANDKTKDKVSEEANNL